MGDAVSAMKFGKFGREDSSLVLVTVGGSLTVKILKRTAQFEKVEAAVGTGGMAAPAPGTGGPAAANKVRVIYSGGHPLPKSSA